MPFKRLRVERSPGAVWFGAALMVFTFAGMQASSDAQLWRPQHLESIGYLYLAAFALGGYCVVRGLFGAWWREVRVDLDARELKTCMGEVVSLDDLGALHASGTELRAANAKTPVFRSSPADVARVRALIEQLLEPRRPRRLFRGRRLTYHRSLGLFLFTLAGFVLLVAVSIAEAHTIGRELTYEPEYKLMVLLGFAVCLTWFRRSLFGTFSRAQLFVDPVAGLLQLADGTLVHFEALGDLSIQETRARAGRHMISSFHLSASSSKNWLYSSSSRPHTQKRLDALETARLQYTLRRALEAPAIDGDAFRSGLDPVHEVKRIAGDSPHARAALDALARDPDPTVRTRAAEARGQVAQLAK